MTNEELIAECKKRGLLVQEQPQKEDLTFSVVVRYDRGLGVEYKSLKTISAKNLGEALEVANSEAESFFKTEAGFERAVINEVKIKPILEATRVVTCKEIKDK